MAHKQTPKPEMPISVGQRADGSFFILQNNNTIVVTLSQIETLYRVATEGKVGKADVTEEPEFKAFMSAMNSGF